VLVAARAWALGVPAHEAGVGETRLQARLAASKITPAIPKRAFV
jgi:hypothetical protein